MTALQSSADGSASRATVFVVDDDPITVNAIARALRSAGYEVRAFRDARQVLATAPGDDPHCLVLDLHMPQLDGLALMDALGQAQRRPPIVFLTGQADVPTATAAMKRGAVDFLTKPANLQQLLDAVASAVARDAAARVTRARVREAAARLATLTAREREVCELVAQGLLNKQVAGELHLAEQTVKVHRERALKKLLVGSVAELVRLLDRAHAATPPAHPAGPPCDAGGLAPCRCGRGPTT